jgi:phage repressor protein C with HTH and peptisase S24 domain
MQVSGDSMEPGIRDGDTVMIDRSRTAVVAGGIYAVGIDDTIMIKRLEKRPGQLALISDNRAYETILVDAGAAAVRILGRVVQLQRRI